MQNIKFVSTKNLDRVNKLSLLLGSSIATYTTFLHEIANIRLGILSTDLWSFKWSSIIHYILSIWNLNFALFHSRYFVRCKKDPSNFSSKYKFPVSVCPSWIFVQNYALKLWKNPNKSGMSSERVAHKWTA